MQVQHLVGLGLGWLSFRISARFDTWLMTYVRVNSSREHYPGHLKNWLVKRPVLRVIFVGKCPASRSFCGGQMLESSVHPINIQN